MDELIFYPVSDDEINIFIEESLHIFGDALIIQQPSINHSLLMAIQTTETVSLLENEKKQYNKNIKTLSTISIISAPICSYYGIGIGIGSAVSIFGINSIYNIIDNRKKYNI